MHFVLRPLTHIIVRDNILNGTVCLLETSRDKSFILKKNNTKVLFFWSLTFFLQVTMEIKCPFCNKLLAVGTKATSPLAFHAQNILSALFLPVKNDPIS